jgi:hypothetical protein
VRLSTHFQQLLKLIVYVCVPLLPQSNKQWGNFIFVLCCKASHRYETVSYINALFGSCEESLHPDNDLYLKGLIPRLKTIIFISFQCS